MFSCITLAQRIPADHPARQIRALVDRALERMDAELEKLYSDTGRPSIAPEWLLRATLLMVRKAPAQLQDDCPTDRSNRHHSRTHGTRRIG